MDRTETVILRALMHDEGYARRVLPFLKSAYFTDRSDRKVYDTIAAFYEKYNSRPTRESLLIDIASLPNLTEQDMREVKELATEICVEERSEQQWLLDTTETLRDLGYVLNAFNRLDEQADLADPQAPFALAAAVRALCPDGLHALVLNAAIMPIMKALPPACFISSMEIDRPMPAKPMAKNHL